MLKFWRKSSTKESNRSNSSSPVDVTSSSGQSFSNVNSVQSGIGSFDSCHSGVLASFEDEGLFDVCEVEATKQHSRLSKTLEEVLDDKSALGHFAQYLETRNVLSLIHCWMDIEQFKYETQKLLTNPKECATEKHRCRSPMLSAPIDHDSLSVSTDCDSYTTDSYSLCDYSSYLVSDSKLSAEIKPSVSDKSKLDVICDRFPETSQTVGSHTCRNEVNSSCSDEWIRNIDKSPVRNKLLHKLTEEALKIFKTYISLEANETIRCVEDIRKEVIESICDSTKILKLTCFESVEKYIRDILEKDYFQGFLASDFFCKHQIDVLTSGNVALDDILYNETALFYFMEFLEQENSRNLLEFWIAASNFQLQLNEQKEFFDPVEAQSDAVVLYDKYFSLQAHCPLGFGDKIRFAVEQSICGENGVMVDCFHLPLTIVEQVLEKNYLKSFVASQLFYKYLSELINSVHNNSMDNKYSPSECSSEKSFCTNSTFLAMEVPQNMRRQKREKGTDMNIDTRQLYDPDSLWKRKRHNRLSLGRISALGKYEPDYDPEPDKSVTSKLKIAVKKFVNIEEDSKKQEMAWQVAEMIVKDITNITLHDQKGFHS
ncbi:hypothetical protein PPYR_11201 [Photinus pyralis]|uniref:RGS domain-containing protein n=1 Tax=Photinus pyralis TaxID=7054 RepID=A0A1Y1K6R9_PHOPY|nr:A-kinase anchor protein 10, mitochondrial [Photinus pyralis]KAB0794362.1 hypothetical protein PPYR_11201 [Photinus pyralis]